MGAHCKNPMAGDSLEYGMAGKICPRAQHEKSNSGIICLQMVFQTQLTTVTATTKIFHLILREFFSGIKRGQQGWHFCLSPAQKGHFCMALFLLNRGFNAKMHIGEYLCNKNEEKIYRFWLTYGQKRGTISIDVTIKFNHSEELKGLLCFLWTVIFES